MSNLTVILFSVCLAAIYCLSEAEDHCPTPPPAGAIYYRATRNCTGVRIIEGKKCCCRCNGNPDARGFYCNRELCLMAVTASTTAASNSTTVAATTSAAGNTTSSASTNSSST